MTKRTSVSESSPSRIREAKAAPQSRSLKVEVAKEKRTRSHEAKGGVAKRKQRRPSSKAEAMKSKLRCQSRADESRMVETAMLKPRSRSFETETTKLKRKSQSREAKAVDPKAMPNSQWQKSKPNLQSRSGQARYAYSQPQCKNERKKNCNRLCCSCCLFSCIDFRKVLKNCKRARFEQKVVKSFANFY